MKVGSFLIVYSILRVSDVLKLHICKPAWLLGVVVKRDIHIFYVAILVKHVAKIICPCTITKVADVQ